jgi:MerR family transcriptional regulator, light-induced transcriptional regulator
LYQQELPTSMTAKRPITYRPVRLSRDYLSGKILDAITREQRREWERFSMERRVEVREEVLFALTALEESLAAGSPVFLLEMAHWQQDRFTARGYPPGFAAGFYSGIAEVVSRDLTEDLRKDGAAFAENAVAAVRSSAGRASDRTKPDTLSPAARAFLKAGLAGDIEGCRAIVKKAQEGRKTTGDIYTGIFTPVLRETGRLWQDGGATIAQEHFISAVVRQSMDRLRGTTTDKAPAPRRGMGVVAACVGEELHDIAIRMAADFFEMDGWDVYYTGANTPAKSILWAVQEHRPVILVLSVTMPSRLPELHYLIRSLRADRKMAQVKIIVGGYPFRILPDLWMRIGADAMAERVEDAVPAAVRLLGRGSGTRKKKA